MRSCLYLSTFWKSQNMLLACAIHTCVSPGVQHCSQARPVTSLACIRCFGDLLSISRYNSCLRPGTSHHNGGCVSLQRLTAKVLLANSHSHEVTGIEAAVNYHCAPLPYTCCCRCTWACKTSSPHHEILMCFGMHFTTSMAVLSARVAARFVLQERSHQSDRSSVNCGFSLTSPIQEMSLRTSTCDG